MTLGLAGCGRFGFTEHAITGDDGPDAAIDASSDAEPPADSATVTTVMPSIDGIVRDGPGTLKNGVPDSVLEGSVVQLLDVPNLEDRGIIEFSLDGIASVSSAQLTLPVFSSMDPFPFDVEVFSYPADGALTLSDWDGGSSISIFAYNGEPSVTLDVTAAVAAQLASPAVGFRFEFKMPSTINLNGPFVAFNSLEFPPVAELTITE